MENIKKSMQYTVASVEYSSIAFYSYIKRTSLFLYRNTKRFGKAVPIPHANYFRFKRKCAKADKNIYIERFDSLEKILEELNRTKITDNERLNSLEKILEELNNKIDSLDKLSALHTIGINAEQAKKSKPVNDSKKMLLHAIFHENKELHNKKQ